MIDDSQIEVISIDPDFIRLSIPIRTNENIATETVSLKTKETTVLDQTTIEVVEILSIEPSGFKVRLGVDAPKNVAIHRKEVYDAINNEQMHKYDTEQQNELERRIQKSDPAPHIAVNFGPGFSEDEIENCLSYLSEVYRSQGGVGLKVVRSQTMTPEESEVPHLS